MQIENAWLELLALTDRLNRSVKEHGWIPADKDRVYQLKDKVIDKLLKEKPDCVEVTLYYSPYILYSQKTKDAAGDMMRREGRKYPFEYYLSQVPPSPEDGEDPSRAAVEIVAVCMGQRFSFHISPSALPVGYSLNALERKEWIPAPQFHHAHLLEAEKEFASLFEALA